MGLPPEPAACVRDAGKKETRCANCPPQVRPKSQRSRAPAFRAFLCVGDAPGLLPGGFPPGRREQEVGFLPARENRSHAWACPRNQPRACETRGRKRHGARIAHRRCARKAKGAKLQLFGRFCALGNVWPHVLHIHGSLARAFARPKGTEAKLFPARENRSSAWACPRNQPRACETGRRHKPGARIAHRRCARKAKGAKLQLFGRFCALGMRRGFCPAGFLPAAGNRR